MLILPPAGQLFLWTAAGRLVTQACELADQEHSTRRGAQLLVLALANCQQSG